MVVGSCKCHALTGLWFHYFLGVERDQCHCYWNPRWQGRSYCHILSRKSEERYLYQFTIYHAVRKNMSKGKVNNLRNWNLGFRVFYLFCFFSNYFFVFWPSLRHTVTVFCASISKGKLKDRFEKPWMKHNIFHEKDHASSIELRRVLTWVNWFIRNLIHDP